MKTTNKMAIGLCGAMLMVGGAKAEQIAKIYGTAPTIDTATWALIMAAVTAGSDVITLTEAGEALCGYAGGTQCAGPRQYAAAGAEECQTARNGWQPSDNRCYQRPIPFELVMTGGARVTCAFNEQGAPRLFTAGTGPLGGTFGGDCVIAAPAQSTIPAGQEMTGFTVTRN